MRSDIAFDCDFPDVIAFFATGFVNHLGGTPQIGGVTVQVIDSAKAEGTSESMASFFPDSQRD